MTPTAARRGSIAAIGIGLLAAGTSIAQATGTAATQPLTAQTQVRANSAGAVQIGMTVKQAEHATGQRFVGPAGQPAAAHPSGCSYVRARQAPRGLSFMLSGTRIVRVDVAAPDATTSTTRAIRRGDSEDAVMRAYPGRITVMPSKYVTHGHDLVYKPASERLARYRIIFQTDGQVVDTILAGRLPEINLVEGCG